MIDGRKDFAKRLTGLSCRHTAMAKGYTASMRGDGLIVVEPRRFAFKLPLRGFVLLMIMFMVFKGFMLASLGDAEYRGKLRILSAGSLYEQAGAFVMGIDPVSNVIAEGFRKVL